MPSQQPPPAPATGADLRTLGHNGVRSLHLILPIASLPAPGPLGITEMTPTRHHAGQISPVGAVVTRPVRRFTGAGLAGVDEMAGAEQRLASSFTIGPAAGPDPTDPPRSPAHHIEADRGRAGACKSPITSVPPTNPQMQTPNDVIMGGTFGENPQISPRDQGESGFAPSPCG
jgi:hypothetical protein